MADLSLGEVIRPDPARKTYFYLGHAYPLTVCRRQRLPLTWSQECGFGTTLNNRRVLRRLLEEWYRHRAHEVIPDRVEHFAGRMRLFPKKIRISGARTRWGSCSGQDTLSFSWRAMILPVPVLDYIVIHELAHLKERNHGPTFWRLVTSFVPDQKTHRAWLRRHTRTLLF
jgi:predicted metal-dependent hydrolase